MVSISDIKEQLNNIHKDCCAWLDVVAAYHTEGIMDDPEDIWLSEYEFIDAYEREAKSAAMEYQEFVNLYIKSWHGKE